MGDETKKEEVRRGNTQPLKPSTAEEVDRNISDVAEMPSHKEAERMPAAVDRDRQPR